VWNASWSLTSGGVNTRGNGGVFNTEKDGLPGLVSMLAIMIAIFTAVGMQFIAQEQTKNSPSLVYAKNLWCVS
jgi:hypothetical protein